MSHTNFITKSLKLQIKIQFILQKSKQKFNSRNFGEFSSQAFHV